VSKQTLGPGDRLVRTGAITFLVGAAGTVVTVAPFLLHTKRLPTPAYFVSMLMALGLAVALCGLLKAALAQRQAAVAADGQDPTAALRERVREQVRAQVRVRDRVAAQGAASASASPAGSERAAGGPAISDQAG
jgi:hypothetical protein